MIYQIFSIFDSAAAVYSQPFYFGTNKQAIRAFSDLTAKEAEDNKYNQHPEDYSLWNLGSFNDGTGIPQHNDNGPQCLMMGHELKSNMQATLPEMESAGDTLEEQMNAARGNNNG